MTPAEEKVLAIARVWTSSWRPLDGCSCKRCVRTRELDEALSAVERERQPRDDEGAAHAVAMGVAP